MSAQLQSLELWRHALVASVRGDAPDLSARQMALILSVYLGDGPHTVRGLAQALRISKPAVSRALDRLGELGYVRRQRDDLDRRNVLVQRTVPGAQFLTEFCGSCGCCQRPCGDAAEQDHRIRGGIGESGGFLRCRSTRMGYRSRGISIKLLVWALLHRPSRSPYPCFSARSRGRHASRCRQGDSFIPNPSPKTK